MYELEDITGNTPLRLDSFQRFEDRVGNWRRWQLLNVHYVLSKRDLDGPGLERVFEEGAVKAYRVGDPLPRAWVVHETIIAGDEGAVEVLNTGDFDPRTTAVLPPESAGIASAVHPGGVEAAPQVVTALPGRLVLDVSAQAAGLLVISQPFYPGWQARVDGEQVPIYRVNSAAGAAGGGRRPPCGAELPPVAAAGHHQPGSAAGLCRCPAPGAPSDPIGVQGLEQFSVLCKSTGLPSSGRTRRIPMRVRPELTIGAEAKMGPRPGRPSPVVLFLPSNPFGAIIGSVATLAARTSYE